MTNRNLIKFIAAAGFTLLAASILSACQAAPQSPEHVVKLKDRTRLDTPAESIYPTLKLTTKDPAATKDFKLKSQTSRYTNGTQSALEITLTDSSETSCENKNPELKEGETVIKLIIASKDDKVALAKGTYTAEKYNLSGTISSMAGGFKKEEKLSQEQISSINVTDLNKAIFRGSFKADGTNTSLEGEFFTAICK